MTTESTSQDRPDFGAAHTTALGLAGVLALLSASCCVLPIGLSILGLGGAWLSMLGIFIAWRMPIQVAVGIVVIWSWARLIMRPKCGRRRTRAIVFACIASLAFMIAASAPLWEADAQRFMWALWRETRS